MVVGKMRMTGARRWGVFNIVGSAGFVVQLAAIAWLTRGWHWHYLAATVAAMELVIIQNYFAHSRWTWADRPALTPRERLMRPLRYQGAKAISLAMNLTLTGVLVSRVGLPPEVANMVAVAVCALYNTRPLIDWSSERTPRRATLF